MGMIVQTLSVLETESEQSLEEAIAQKFEVSKSDESLIEEQPFVGTT